jgi:hypothetical protein
MDDNGLEKYDLIKGKIRDGEEKGQKNLVQQVSEYPPLICAGKHTNHFSCLNR